jgi:cobalamin biosynthesis protein CobT
MLGAVGEDAGATEDVADDDDDEDEEDEEDEDEEDEDEEDEEEVEWDGAGREFVVVGTASSEFNGTGTRGTSTAAGGARRCHILRPSSLLSDER